ILFILSVLVQDKGSGLSSTFGGSGGFYASQRGAAKVIHYLSLVFCFIFFATALVYVVLPDAGPETSLEAPGAPLEITPGVEGAPVQITPEAVQ
ncbi:MAG: preprotein translocase subunit SecG, partial [Candidatus Altimarinota bacterium]